jgi:DNA-binding response OmpR family regulator
VHDGRRRRVLVAEDEVLISMLIEEDLEAAGYSIIGPFRTCAEASRWLQHDTPDLAVLDYGLADGPCTDAAVELKQRGVPFLVLTGEMVEDLPDVFRDCPQVAKPSSPEKLLAEMQRLSS